jgi:hypothetical protein
MHQILFHIFHQNNYDLNQVHAMFCFAIERKLWIEGVNVFIFTSNASINWEASSSLNLFPINNIIKYVYKNIFYTGKINFF